MHFSPDHFAELGHHVVDLLTAHLRDAQADGVVPVMPALSPRDACANYPDAFSAEPALSTSLPELLKRVIADSTSLHAPRFMGHQVSTPPPAAAVIEMMSALLNNGMAIFEMGKAATAMERAVLRHVAVRMGFPQSAAGILTSGGSLGNLTALLAARQARAGSDVWRQGMRPAAPLAVLTGRTTHYSVARATRIAGFGNDGCIAVDVDDKLRMKPAALEQAIHDAHKKKRTIVAVVASAGSTAAGAIDPLNDIADICASHGIWLHVDGAHGGALVFSDHARAKVKGIERADSVVMDFHKMLMMPALSTAVLFRDAHTGAAAFAQEAGYLFDDNTDDDAWSDVGKRTIECTKRMLSLPIYATLQAYGTRFFADHIDASCRKTAVFASMIEAEPSLELLTVPDINITCFRVKGMTNGQTAALRKAIVAEGAFYIVQVHIEQELWLRTTLLNPNTTHTHLRALVDRLTHLQ
jgi:L-2,4-diaminobutyrate decarboxylase